jgi:hypothetical protein
MLLKKYKLFITLFLLTVSISFGQVLKLNPYNGDPSSYLVAQIIADTTANKGILATRIYELEAGGIYLNTATLTVSKQYTIRIRGAAGGKKPIIYQYPTGTGTTPQNPPGNLFVLAGASLEMSNVAVAGYFEPIPDNFNTIQGGLVNTTAEGSSIKLDNVLFNHINGQHVRTGSATKTVKVTNCIFADMGALITSNLGAGKGLDLREVSCDSLIIVNNTFINYQDRVIRHYNVAAGNPYTANLKYVLIDHNSFINGMGFHGLLNLGNVGKQVSIKNNLFYDAFAAGEDSTDGVRAAEWANTGEKYPSGKNKMYWIFTAPNDTTKWIVRNNVYTISSAGQAFFNAHTKEPIVEGNPLSQHIRKRLGADSTKAFSKISLTPNKIPKLMTNMMEWYLSPTGGNKTKNTPSSLWDKTKHDMDRRTVTYFTDTLDASYGTTVTAYTGAERNFPVGDLNWYKTKKTEWIAAGGTDVKNPEALPTGFTLEQNYPNPFNPSTSIRYTLPIESKVKLEVFDLLGRSVDVLVDDLKPAGFYEVSFDASKFASGVYIYRITTFQNTISKKMLLIK